MITHTSSPPPGGGSSVARSIAADGKATAALALEDIHRLHGTRVLRFLIRESYGDLHLAEDLYQETMLRAWRFRTRVPEEPGRVLPWLLRVARNVAIDTARARKSRITELQFGLACAPEAGLSADVAERVSDVLSVRTALAGLRKQHRSVLFDLYYRNRRIDEIALADEIPAGTVKSRSNYALRALRAAMTTRSRLSAETALSREHTGTTH